MLTTQIQYWTLVESKRHNLATEDLQNRSLNEDIRHNVVTENETQRHNIATENYYTNLLSETTRHNVEQEGIAKEGNLISWRNTDINAMNATSNRMQAQAALSNAATQRFSAVTGAALGLTKAQIDQQNAETNRINSEIASQRQQTDWLQWVTGTNQTDIAKQNAATNVMNAETNAYNAETNRINAETGVDSLNLQQEKFDWSKGVDVSQQMNNWANTVIKGVDAASDLSGKSTGVQNILKSLIK